MIWLWILAGILSIVLYLANLENYQKINWGLLPVFIVFGPIGLFAQSIFWAFYKVK